MADLIRIWIEISHNAAFRTGGWAFVLAEGSACSGAAGGERTGSPERIALAGLTQALKGAPTGMAVEILSSAPLVRGAARRLDVAAEPPSDDLELWAQLATALRGRTARFAVAANAPRTPTGFAIAWAELARDKAKTAGSFRAAIPKLNLSKAGVPA